MRSRKSFMSRPRRFARRTIKPVLRWPESPEAGCRGAQVDLLPLGVEAGGLQLLEMTEEIVDEAREASIMVGPLRPVVGRKYGRHGDGCDLRVPWHQTGIIGRLDR